MAVVVPVEASTLVIVYDVPCKTKTTIMCEWRRCLDAVLRSSLILLVLCQRTDPPKDINQTTPGEACSAASSLFINTGSSQKSSSFLVGSGYSSSSCWRGDDSSPAGGFLALGAAGAWWTTRRCSVKLLVACAAGNADRYALSQKTM